MVDEVFGLGAQSRQVEVHAQPARAGLVGSVLSESVGGLKADLHPAARIAGRRAIEQHQRVRRWNDCGPIGGGVAQQRVARGGDGNAAGDTIARGSFDFERAGVVGVGPLKSILRAKVFPDAKCGADAARAEAVPKCICGAAGGGCRPRDNTANLPGTRPGWLNRDRDSGRQMTRQQQRLGQVAESPKAEHRLTVVQ